MLLGSNYDFLPFGTVDRDRGRSLFYTKKWETCPLVTPKLLYLHVHVFWQGFIQSCEGAWSCSFIVRLGLKWWLVEFWEGTFHRAGLSEASNVMNYITNCLYNRVNSKVIWFSSVNNEDQWVFCYIFNAKKFAHTLTWEIHLCLCDPASLLTNIYQ